MFIELKNKFSGENELVNLNRVCRIIEHYDKEDFIYCTFVIENDYKDYVTSIYDINLHLRK